MINHVMPLIDLLQSELSFLLILSGVFGLVLGSFINVVIYRLPKMIESQWKQNNRSQNRILSKKYNLITPRSQCQSCGHRISIFENLPLFSYLWLKGRCRHCKAHISLRYPLIELACGFATSLCFWHFGFSLTALAASIFVLSLITLSMIDFDTYLLPDLITLPLLWLGLLFNLSDTFVDIQSAVIGSVLGYLILWSIYWIYKLIKNKESMGYGDFKLLAAVGAWFGWQAIPEIILISSVIATVIGLAIIIFGKSASNVPIPFGPFISLAAILILFLA